MGHRGVWVMRNIGYEGFGCIRYFIIDDCGCLMFREACADQY